MSDFLKDGGAKPAGILSEDQALKVAGTYKTEKHDDAGKQLKLAQRVKMGLAEYCHYEPMHLDVDSVLVGPMNRDGAPPNLQYIHHGIIGDFLKSGFSRSRPQEGICVRYTSEAGNKMLLEHNQRLSKGCPMLPPIDEPKALYGSLAGTHLNIAGRILKAKTQSPLGDLSQLLQEDEDLKEFVQHGHKWWIIDEAAPHELQMDISMHRNQDQNNNQATHEIELLQTITTVAKELATTRDRVLLPDMQYRATNRHPSKLPEETMRVLCKYYKAFLDGGNQNLVRELVDWHSTNVNPKELRVSTLFFKLLCGNDELKGHPLTKHYLLLCHYTKDNMLKAAAGAGTANFVDPKSVVQLIKQPATLQALEDQLKELRGSTLQLLEKSLPEKQALMELAELVNLIMRCVLNKPWPQDSQLKLPIGKFGTAKVKQLENHWARMLDKKYPHFMLGSACGLVIQEDQEEDPESQQEVNLQALRGNRALERQESAASAASDGPRTFKRGDKVSVIRRMTWAIPQASDPDFRKNLDVGVEGVIDGWTDKSLKMVMLKVVMNLPDGDGIIFAHQCYPRNLKLTSEYELDKEGTAREGEAAPESKKKQKPLTPAQKEDLEFLQAVTGSSEPEQVKVEDSWDKDLLSEADLMSKTWFLRMMFCKPFFLHHHHHHHHHQISPGVVSASAWMRCSRCSRRSPTRISRSCTARMPRGSGWTSSGLAEP